MQIKKKKIQNRFFSKYDKKFIHPKEWILNRNPSITLPYNYICTSTCTAYNQKVLVSQHCSHTSWYTWALSYPPTGTWPCIGEVAHMMGRRTSSDLRCSLYIHCDLGGKPMLGISSAIVTAASVKQEKLWRASSLPFLQG